MKTLWRLSITLAVIYLLFRNPFFFGDAINGIRYVRHVVDGLGKMNSARAQSSTELVITPCNLDGTCRDREDGE